jgi:excisionase family DNA binding protein
MPAPASDGDLDALDINTVCRRSGLGRTYVYEAIRRGELRARKYGRLTRILRRDYEDWLAAAPEITPTIARDAAPQSLGASGPRLGTTRQPISSRRPAVGPGGGREGTAAVRGGRAVPAAAGADALIVR